MCAEAQLYSERTAMACDDGATAGVCGGGDTDAVEGEEL